MPNRTLRARRLTGSRLVVATVLGLAFSVITAAPSYAATGTISIIQGGTGAGTVTSIPAGINCHIDDVSGPTGACSVPFEEGTKVRLKAVADEGSKFTGWTPENSCPKASIKVEAGATYECRPFFEPR